MNKVLLDNNEIDKLIIYALQEDIGSGDVTTDNIVDEFQQSSGTLIAKADGVISGLPIAKRVFDILEGLTGWTAHFEDGDFVKSGDIIVEFEGYLKPLLKAERTALNFLQRMSGIATKTSRYVKLLTDYNTKILDTRKTVPGMRMLDKYAVSCGGGVNHRIGLYDMVMIKDNHIKAAGNISRAVELVKANIKPNIRIEVETTNPREVKEALASGIDVIMLDNMSTEEMKEAVSLIDGKVEIEASGNMTATRLVETAEAGVDFISVGALTHSAEALDISMRLK